MIGASKIIGSDSQALIVRHLFLRIRVTTQDCPFAVMEPLTLSLPRISGTGLTRRCIEVKYPAVVWTGSPACDGLVH